MTEAEVMLLAILSAIESVLRQSLPFLLLSAGIFVVTLLGVIIYGITRATFDFLILKYKEKKQSDV